MKPFRRSWTQILSWAVGALMAVLGTVWATGVHAGSQQTTIEELKADRLPRIEKKLDTLSDSIQDLRILVERTRQEVMDSKAEKK